MPDISYTTSKPNLAYAKLVATPTDTSWSQVYNAGNLFACISLTIEGELEEEISLPVLGKEILDILQSEFFVLDKKTIPTISEVITKSIEHVQEPVTVDVTLGFFKDNILYLFVVGHGRVIMKRKGKIGRLLQGKEGQKAVLTASGYLHNEDTVILETKQFAEDINDTTLASSLELVLPNDIAEALSPQMHKKEDGGQAAIIVMYHGVSGGIIEEEKMVGAEEETSSSYDHPDMPLHNKDPFEHTPSIRQHNETEESSWDDKSDDEDEEQQRETSKKRFHMQFPPLSNIGSLKMISSKLPFSSSGFKLTHSRRLFLSIGVILIILLAVSIFFTKKKEADEQQKVLFNQVYEPAKNKYESAQALETLNPKLSYDDYLEAKKLLTDNSNKFASDSEEAKKIQQLLSKIEAELQDSSQIQTANAKEISLPENSYLPVAKANSSGAGFTQDTTNVYFVTSNAVVSVNKNSGSKTDLIKNDNNWEEAVGLATYQGNFYILDRKKGVVKFVAAGEGYSAGEYFKDNPDLSSATDLAIDSAIWILLKDGTILKYTSGVSDGFKAPKLEKPMANPAKIFTDPDTNNLYILDKGNSRIVRIAKEGSAHTEYASSVIKQAKDFEVKEKDKKILILSGDKTYEIAL